MKRSVLLSALVLAAAASGPSRADPSGLLFYVSGDHGLTADVAGGEAAPNFADKIKVVPGGPAGPYIQADGDQVLSWKAPGNVYAQRGTLAFLWRARDPLGRGQFPIFRVGYGDHSSWDMVWLRIDWNGHGFDAFVTDDNLARTRVSWTVPEIPKADRWIPIAFSWDQTKGIRLYVDGRLVARKDEPGVWDAALDQFGPNSRVISPHQVQSAYQYRRGGDIDEIRIYDRMLDDRAVAELAKGKAPEIAAAPARDLSDPATRAEWLMRWGWNRRGDPPPYLADAQTRIRKVEFTDARDLKERMTNANDGIAETTWPGVYNRSRLPGRHDYFELPDWNVYVQGGKSITFTLPDEPWNRIEFQGAAYGSLTFVPPGGAEQRLAERPKGQERTFHALPELRGGKLRFDNVVQETPIQEIAAYDVTAGGEPQGARKLSYTIRASARTDYPSLSDLRAYIAGRYAPDERATVAALPENAPMAPRSGPRAGALPIVHVLIPADFRDVAPKGAVGHYSYGWENMSEGLDGIAIDLPPLKVKPTHGGLFPLNIQIKDPIWPARNLMDVSVSVKPGEARTLWLDTRDRLLPNGKSLWLTIAGAGGDFGPEALDGTRIRLVFKPRAQALPEHIADRWAEVRDNLAWLVEEHTNTRRLSRFARLEADFTDLFRADPDHQLGRLYWAEINPEQGWPAFEQPKPPAGVPLWAFRQVEDLKLVRNYVNWWIDERQVAFGDFGGGISDDDDLTQQWPPLALMGVDPDKIQASLLKLVDAAYANGMITNGLGTIKTDELHSYEEGLNAQSEAMYLAWGDPKTVERLMGTARNYWRITATNAAGHTHIASSLFSGTDTVREGPWRWSKPYSYLILHPGLMLAEFNGDPRTKQLIIALAHSHLAHGERKPDGSWSFPADIAADTDEARGELGSKVQGGTMPLQLFWAAYRWTGDPAFLRPLQAQIGKDGLDVLADINENSLDVLGERAAWGPRLIAAAGAPKASNFDRYAAWEASGDKRWLEDLYAREIQTDSQRMYMVTEGHWWSDRVELFSDLLQRSRLGGMALRRNQIVPGHTVSWRFDAPGGATDVAILVEAATPKHFKVVAYNLSDRPVSAKMTGWDVAPGTWRMRSGVDRTGKDVIDGPGQSREVELETSRSVAIAFPPHETAVFTFDLAREGAPVWNRPDIGIDRGDVHVAENEVRLTVHSLGAKAAPAGVAAVTDAAGHVLAKAAIAPLKAPLDLQPKTTEVVLRLHGPVPAGAHVRVALDGGVREITEMNNDVVLP